MTQRFSLITAAFLALTSLTTPSEGAPSKSEVAGTYVASVSGTSMTLVLNANGTGSLNGEVGTWSLSGRQINLYDDEGTTIAGTVGSNTLTFTVEGQTIRFIRRGGKAASARSKAKSAKLEAFKPALVKGKKVKPKNSNGSFRVPSGFKHGWGEGVDGGDAYNLTSKDQAIVLSIGRTMLSGSDANADIATLLNAGLAELLDGAAVDTVVPTEAFTVDGKTAGRVVVRGNVGGQKLEGYLGALVDGTWAFGVVGLYKVADAKRGRAAADTVLATLKVKAPKPNKALMRKAVGCWDYSKGGDGSFIQDRLFFAADGSYERHYMMSVSNVDVGTGYETSGVSDIDKSKGTWGIFGSELVLSPEGKDSKTQSVRIQGRGLRMNGKLYIKC